MNRQQVMKSVLVSLSFFAFVACGSSKTEPKGIEVAPAKTTPPLPSDQANGPSDPEASPQAVPATPPIEVPKGSEESDSSDNNNNNNNNGSGTQGGANNNGGTNSDGSPQASQQTPSVGGAGGGGELQLTELQQRKNAAEHYTGASDDILRSVLKSRMESVQDENLALRNIRMAQSITDARLKLDQETGDVVVLVKIKGSDNKERDTILSGSLVAGADGYKTTELTAIEADGKVSGKIICMDADQTECTTSHTRLEIGDVGRRAIVNIIFRNTNLKITGNFPESVRTIREMEDFYALIKNTELKRTCDNSLQAGRVETAEIIQGKSLYKVFLKSFGNELIMMAGELRKAQNGQLNIRASRDIAESDLINMDQSTQYKTRIHETLGNLRLVQNSGLGNLVFNADFTSRVGAQQNGQNSTVEIKIDRKQTALRRLFNL